MSRKTTRNKEEILMTPEVANLIWEISVIFVIVLIAGLSFYGEAKEKKEQGKK